MPKQARIYYCIHCINSKVHCFQKCKISGIMLLGNSPVIKRKPIAHKSDNASNSSEGQKIFLRGQPTVMEQNVCRWGGMGSLSQTFFAIKDKDLSVGGWVGACPRLFLRSRTASGKIFCNFYSTASGLFFSLLVYFSDPDANYCIARTPCRVVSFY